MTAKRMIRIDRGVDGQEDGSLFPQGLQQRYWQGGHGILQ